MSFLENIGLSSKLKEEDKIRREEDSIQLIRQYIKPYEDIISFKNHKKYKLANRENIYRFTTKLVSLDFLLKISEDRRVKNLFFSPSTPPPGQGIDSISMRYKIYIEYYSFNN